MSEKERTDFKKDLQKWEVQLKPDPHTAQHVLNRIASEQFLNSPEKRFPRLIPFLLATGIAAVLVFGTVFIINQQAQTRLIQDNQYLSLIDPVTRVQSHEGNTSKDLLLEQLAWMQNRLDLSRDQFMELVGLHQNYSDKFNGLYEELVRLESEYDHFEALRKNNEMVDFMALYDVLLERKETESLAHSLSQELIAKVSSILTPSQRTTYLSMVTLSTNPNA